MRLRNLLSLCLLAAAATACDRATPAAPEASASALRPAYSSTSNTLYIFGPSTIQSPGSHLWEARGTCELPYYWTVEYADGTTAYYENDGYLELWVDYGTPDFVIHLGAGCYDETGMVIWQEDTQAVDNQLN